MTRKIDDLSPHLATEYSSQRVSAMDVVLGGPAVSGKVVPLTVSMEKYVFSGASMRK